MDTGKTKNTKIFITAVILMLLMATSVSFASSNEYKRTFMLMDTVFSITLYADNEQSADKAFNDAFKRLKDIESELNIFNADSGISKLNRDKKNSSPSVDLKINIEKAIFYSNKSGGAFDITVQPILDLYKKSFGDKKSPPTDIEIRNELKKVDYRKIRLQPGKIEIGKNQRITLGGIAKGYAVEEAIKVLKNNNITMALVDAGGNIRVLGQKPSGPWKIALRNPRNEQDYITIIPMVNNAVSTSGDYERFFNEEKTFHHIVDPRTGYSATELISVTIVTDNAFDADALSTSVFVLGRERGMKLIESIPGVEGLIITRDKKIYKTSGFKEAK
jgi:FAD:protein FMN transferase